MSSTRFYRRHHLVGPNGKTGLSAATIARQILKGQFPAPVPLGARAVGWPSDAIEKWIAERSAKAAK